MSCKRCNDTGLVPDGEIPSAFGNEPIKCVKDCPVCKGNRLSGSPATAPGRVPLRMLTLDECNDELPTPRDPGEFKGTQTVAFTWLAWQTYITAIQRKFCEVNGLSLSAANGEVEGAKG
jgi:hypothetical protein